MAGWICCLIIQIKIETSVNIDRKHMKCSHPQENNAINSDYDMYINNNMIFYEI